MNQRQQCIKNCKSIANMKLYNKIAKFANGKLGHMWDFTVDDILKVMHAVILYNIEKGEIPKEKEAQDIMLRSLYWTEADGAIKIITHSI